MCILNKANESETLQYNGDGKMEELLTIEELAEYLKISKHTLYKMVEKGKLPALKIANQWRFKKGKIEKWLEEHENEYLGKKAKK